MPDPVDIFRKPLVLQPPASEVEIRRDIVYREDLLADFYLPPRRERRPVVIFIHGGPAPRPSDAAALKPKDWRIFQDYGRLLASSGFVAVTFNYRFLADEIDRATTDVEVLIEFVRSQIDADQLFLWAFSGGGLFLTTGFERQNVRGLIGYYAVLDVATPELRSRLSPIERLKKNGCMAPIFLARAGMDQQLLNEAMQQFIDEALRRNVEIELMNHPAGAHGFDILNEDDRSRAIIRRTIEFIREHAR
jgi:BD-FAE protein